MAFDFTNAAAELVTANATTPATATWAAWIFQNASPTANQRIFSKENSGSTTLDDLICPSGGTVILNAKFTVTSGQWSCPSPATGAWHHVAVTYDNSLAANAPVMYVDGVSQTVTTAIPAVGAYSSFADLWRVGNRGNHDRSFKDFLAEAAMWNRILTADEIAALAKGFSPSNFVRGRVLYCPMVRDAVDLSASAAASAGSTAVAAHPRTYY